MTDGAAIEPPTRMSDEDYALVQMQLLTMGQLIHALDLDGFLRRSDGLDAIGPIVDPTIWRRGHKRLAAIREVARAAKVFKSAWGELAEVIQNEEGAR